VERIASIIRVKRNGELGRLVTTSNVILSSPIITQMIEAIRSSETSVLTRATQRHVSEDGILQTMA
jgi:hypothetical protein